MKTAGRIAIGAVGVVVVLGTIGAITGPSTPTAPATPAASQVLAANPTSTTTTPPTPTGPVTTFGDGTYAVGTDIKPGTYHTNGPSTLDPMGCYWQRSTDTSGNMGSIIANNISKGPATVTISTTDGAFETEGCTTWSLVK